MANYKMSGFDLKDRNNRTLGKIVGDQVREYPSNKTLLKIIKDEIREYPSNKTLLKIIGDDVREYPSNRSIAKVSEIKKLIDGSIGGPSIVALWLAFIR